MPAALTMPTECKGTKTKHAEKRPSQKSFVRLRDNL